MGLLLTIDGVKKQILLEIQTCSLGNADIYLWSKNIFYRNNLITQIWSSVFSFNISVLESASAWNLEEVKFESLIELALGKSSSGVEVDLELKWSFSGCKKKLRCKIQTSMMMIINNEWHRLNLRPRRWREIRVPYNKLSSGLHRHSSPSPRTASSRKI